MVTVDEDTPLKAQGKALQVSRTIFVLIRKIIISNLSLSFFILSVYHCFLNVEHYNQSNNKSGNSNKKTPKNQINTATSSNH